MAISFSRPDPSSPSSVASASFTTARKGFETSEVREFLRMVAAELARLQERERFLERELRTAQRTTTPAAVALDDELVTKMLGEEAARILHTSRDAAAQIRMRAEDSAARLLREATDEAQRLREEAEIEAARRRADATADAEAELEMAKQQGRDMVNEARAYRERVLNELARRREIARQQIEQLVHGRDRLLQAFERARLVSVDVMAELTPLGEPSEYVNLSPTTGPVPLMVPNMPRPGSAPASEPAPPDATVALAVSSRVPLVDAPAEVATADEAATADTTVTTDTADALDTVDDGPMIVPHDPSVTIFVDEEFEQAELPADEPEGTEAEATELEIEATEIEDAEIEELDDVRDRVVQLDIAPRHHDHDDDHDDDHDGEVAPVVALFAGEPVTADETTADDDTTDDSVEAVEVEVVEVEAVEVEAVEVEAVEEVADAPVTADPDATTALGRTSADDLFARLRAARAEAIAERAAAATVPAASAEPAVSNVPDTPVVPPVASVGDSVFLSTPDAPVAETDRADTPFARRDEALTPLITAAARKLKRVLADEQNEVLHALRRKEPVRDLATMLPSAAEQCDRYGAAIASELVAAATAGAVSMGMSPSAATREVKQAGASAQAVAALADDVVMPLRDRLARCLADADGDNHELGSLVRLAYREWKTQRIDEHLDDVARLAYGRGALAGVAPGTPVCWVVDPDGPECADAEDNSLAGAVPAGSPFPTDHPCAPAHPGCRCLVRPAD